METEGPDKGKIVVAREDGTTDPDAAMPLDLSITKNVVGMFFAAIVMTGNFPDHGNSYRQPAKST
jgi:hypothetical protein